MLVPRLTQRERRKRHGSGCASLAELRRQLARPSRIQKRHRQRLLDLSHRLAHVQELGGEFARVEFSDKAVAALAGEAAAV